MALPPAPEDDPLLEAQPARPSRPPPDPARRLAIAVAAALAGGGLVLGAFLIAEPLVRARVSAEVVRQAASMGLALDPGAVSFGWGWVTLNHARFTLEGTDVVSGTAERVSIKLDGLKPLDIKASGVAVGLEGSPGAVLGALSSWEKRREAPASSSPAGTPAPPMTASGLSFSWRETRGAAPWVTADGELASTTVGGSLRANHTMAGDHDLGVVTVSWARTAQGLVFAPVASDPASASVRLELPQGTPLPTARLIAQNTPTSLFGLKLAAARNTTIDGTLELRFPAAGGIEGSLQGALKGFVVPVPREIASLVSNKETTVTATIRGAPGANVAELSPLTITSGSVKLSGPGTLRHEPNRGIFHAQLSGALPCAAVARSTATTDLGSLLGGVLGEVAGLAMDGSVSLGLTVDADTQNLAAARLKPSFGVGCGLRLPIGLLRLLPSPT